MAELRDRLRDLAGGVTDALIDGFRRVNETGIKGMVRSFEQALLDMAWSAARSWLFSLLEKLFQGAFGGFGGGLGLGGGGGDTAFSGGFGQGTPFGRLELPGAGGGGNVYVTVHAADADSFRRNEEQIHDAMFRASAKATRRNTGRI